MICALLFAAAIALFAMGGHADTALACVAVGLWGWLAALPGFRLW
jgi:hypothetical protein